MSSLLLSHPQVLSFRRPSLIGFTHKHRNVECFSSSSQKIQIPPSVIYDLVPCERGFGKPMIKIDSVLWDLHKKVPMELAKEKGIIVGGSHGWVATLKKDGVLRLQDDLNPSASDSNPKRIPLPPFVTLPHCQTQIITNIAMSSSSPEEDDGCVVAIKFLGPQLSLWRKNLGWINIDTRNPSFFSSHVMFSKKEKMFRLPSSGGHVIGSWDLQNHMHKPKLQKVRFRNLPKLTKSKWALLDSCSRSEHLVESPDGRETFMVKWYKKKTKGYAKMRTKAIMVFKLDEEGNAVYTQDIGDLCIFLSISEAFSIPGTSTGDFFKDHNNKNYFQVYFKTYDEEGYVDIELPFDVYFGYHPCIWNPVPCYIPPQTTEYSLTTACEQLPWGWEEMEP